MSEDVNSNNLQTQEIIAAISQISSDIGRLGEQLVKTDAMIEGISLEVARLGEQQRIHFSYAEGRFEQHDLEIRKNGILLEELNHKLDLGLELFQIQNNNLAMRVDALEKFAG